MKKNKKKFIYREEYIVTYDKKEGEYWKRHLEESIFIPLKPDQEKNSTAHDQARDFFLEKHRGEEVVVTRVTYV